MNSSSYTFKNSSTIINNNSSNIGTSNIGKKAPKLRPTVNIEKYDGGNNNNNNNYSYYEKNVINEHEHSY